MDKLFKVRINAPRICAWYKFGDDYIVKEKNLRCVEVVDGPHTGNVIDKAYCDVICEVIQKITYEEVKPKIKKYKVLYRLGADNYFITSSYYKDINEYLTLSDAKFCMLIEDSMIEEEEDVPYES